MKRRFILITLLLSMALVMIVALACGPQVDPIIGVWNLKEFGYGNNSKIEEHYDEINSTITFYSDGRCFFEGRRFGNNAECHWERLSNGKYTIFAEGDSFEFILENPNTLIYKNDIEHYNYSEVILRYSKQ